MPSHRRVSCRECTETRYYCNGCKTHQDRDQFFFKKDQPHVSAGSCRTCRKRYNKSKGYDEASYGPRQEAVKDWRERNKEHYRATQYIAWKRTYPVWYARYRDKKLAYTASYVTRKLDVFDENVDRRVVWGRDEGCCRVKLVCNGDFVPFEQMHLDHVIPLTKGGRHAYSNVQTSCAPCNLSKGARILERT